MVLSTFFAFFSAAALLALALNRLSYLRLKIRIIGRARWDLNICCGATDGGGVNADIVRHSPRIPNFVRVDDIYRLPFRNRQFKRVLCSHTMEHVDDPERFDRELRRVGETVLYLLPPLWDVAAAFNLLEHKWIFLTFRKEHRQLPRHVKLPLSWTLQRHFKQRVKA